MSRRLNALRALPVLLPLAWLPACSATRQVTASPQSDVLVLTPQYAVAENLGPAPVEIITSENLARFRFERKKKAPEFLLVLFPDKLKGAIDVKLADGVAAGVAAVASSSYFDQVLRAHRLILRGDVDEASALITRIRAQYDDGYATSILAGNVALLKGDSVTAARQFLFAKSLLPDAPVPAPFLPQGEGTK
jgi:hypothetical protein